MTKLINENIFNYINFNQDVEAGQSLAVPNEIFNDFKSLGYKIGKCAYAYCYYYLQMYLHLYAKYGSEDTVDKFTFSNIQRLLGVSGTSRSMNSIVKKDGDLDNLGYTSTVTDYPVDLLRLQRVDSMMEVTHYMYSEEKEELGIVSHSPNFTVKHPDKMYWRDKESKFDSYYNGTMNMADNTHIIPIEMFLHALNISAIGTKGFYVYAFIIFKNDKRRKRGWTISADLLAHDLGVSKKTATSIVSSLIKHGFVRKISNKALDGTDKPNTYVPILDPSNVIYETADS